MSKHTLTLEKAKYGGMDVSQAQRLPPSAASTCSAPIICASVCLLFDITASPFFRLNHTQLCWKEGIRSKSPITLTHSPLNPDLSLMPCLRHFGCHSFLNYFRKSYVSAMHERDK
jgi:hypothetical protein